MAGVMVTSPLGVNLKSAPIIATGRPSCKSDERLLAWIAGVKLPNPRARDKYLPDPIPKQAANRCASAAGPRDRPALAAGTNRASAVAASRSAISARGRAPQTVRRCSTAGTP